MHIRDTTKRDIRMRDIYDDISCMSFDKWSLIEQLFYGITGKDSFKKCTDPQVYEG